MDQQWKEILERSTPNGAVSALIIDMVALDKHIRALPEVGVSGDTAAVIEKLNELRSAFTREFNQSPDALDRKLRARIGDPVPVPVWDPKNRKA